MLSTQNIKTKDIQTLSVSFYFIYFLLIKENRDTNLKRDIFFRVYQYKSDIDVSEKKRVDV